jgi:hypothetical protein
MRLTKSNIFRSVEYTYLKAKINIIGYCTLNVDHVLHELFGGAQMECRMISNIYTKFQQVSSPQITVFIDLKQNTAASQGFSKQPNLSSFNKYRNPI